MKFPLSRRTLLRGAGAAIGLPWLEAMAAPGAPKPPVRLAALYMPNGVNVDAWMPKGKGREFDLSDTLEPLRPVKDSVTVLSNLWNQNAKGGDGQYRGYIVRWLPNQGLPQALRITIGRPHDMDAIAAALREMAEAAR